MWTLGGGGGGACYSDDWRNSRQERTRKSVFINKPHSHILDPTPTFFLFFFLKQLFLVPPQIENDENIN